jgi:hypothetical protein
VTWNQVLDGAWFDELPLQGTVFSGEVNRDWLIPQAANQRADQTDQAPGLVALEFPATHQAQR